MSSLYLVRKGQSRCFVFKEEHKQIVHDVAKQLDEFEYDYMPDDWVTAIDPADQNQNLTSQLVYNGKFDINVLSLIDACGQAGVGILILSTNIS